MPANPFPTRCAAKFEPLRMLAQGGFATVWLARQRGLERLVAVKLLFEHLLDDASEVARFRDEARITASFHHPHIVTVIDHDVEAGIPWIAYEYLAGKSLRETLKGGALPPTQALEVAIQVASVLEEVHGAGILHRDIKPENVLEATPGLFKVTDFGIAKWYLKRRAHTRTGRVPGTIYYVAPELIEGAPPSAQSDIYSLGIMTFEMLSGGVPFAGDGPLAIYKCHLESAVPAISTLLPGLPSQIDRLLFTALAKEPRARHGSVAALRTELEAALEELHVRSLHRRMRAEQPVQTPVLGTSSTPATPRLAASVRAARASRLEGWRQRGVRAVALAALMGVIGALPWSGWSGAVVQAMGRPAARALAAPMVTGNAGLAIGPVLTVAAALRDPPRERAPRPDPGPQIAELEAIAAALVDGRRVNVEVVTRLTPMAGAAELDEAQAMATGHLARLEKLHERASRCLAAGFGEVDAAELAALPAAQLALLERAQALTFVTWSQLVCARRLLQCANYLRAGTTLALTGWADTESPLFRAHYGADGVPLLAAFLRTCLAALKRSGAPGAHPGGEIAELFGDLQLVSWAGAQAEWEAHAQELLAPQVKAFKAGLGDLSGREGQALRWTAWCLWGWAEAGRAQGNGRFYRKSALEALQRLQDLVPSARPRLALLVTRLNRTWGSR